MNRKQRIIEMRNQIKLYKQTIKDLSLRLSIKGEREIIFKREDLFPEFFQSLLSNTDVKYRLIGFNRKYVKVERKGDD